MPEFDERSQPPKDDELSSENKERAIPGEIPVENQTQPQEEKHPSLIRYVMEGHLRDAQELATSPDEYRRDAYDRAEKRLAEIQQYIEEGILTPSEGFKITAALIANKEIHGLVDPKTNLFNELGFNQQLAAMISHARRSKENVALAYFDLVGFKTINDTLGHETGDIVLKYFADYIREELGIRPEDVFARLGGDEFVIAFPNGREDLLRERFGEGYIRSKLTEYIHKRMDTDKIDSRDTRVTARVGVVSLREGDTAKTLKNNADQAMNAQRDQNDKPSR